jgi:hypothetical protein
VIEPLQTAESVHNGGMITEEVAYEWARLVQFRAEVYSTFQRRADAVFELIDALAADTQARSPVELSLSPFFHRQYACIYDGLDAWKYNADALDKILLGRLSSREAGGFRLWAVDETPRRRQYAPTVADRAYVHYPNPVGTNKPITIGHNYGALVHIELEGPSTWAPAWALERTPTDWTGVDLALEQIVRLVHYDDGWHIVTADSRYGTPLYIAGLYQCPNVTGVTRLSSPRNLYHKAPPYSGFGRPRIHDDVFKLHDATTWGEPDERVEFTEQDAKGRSVRVIIEAWHEMHFQKAPHCRFTLVKVTTYKADGQLRFKHPLWLAVTHRHGLSLKEIRAAYLRRPVIEHFNRFIKQHLLFEAAQMGSVEQDERWAQVVKLGYWQLYASRNAVERDVRPWERYKPRPPADQPATPSQTRRAFGRLLPDLGTPARAPQLRGKSPRRPKGYRPEPRKRFPVVYKGRKQPPSLT